VKCGNEKERFMYDVRTGSLDLSVTATNLVYPDSKVFEAVLFLVVLFLSG
jgi:hypothetical protein